MSSHRILTSPRAVWAASWAAIEFWPAQGQSGQPKRQPSNFLSLNGGSAGQLKSRPLAWRQRCGSPRAALFFDSGVVCSLTCYCICNNVFKELKHCFSVEYMPKRDENTSAEEKCYNSTEFGQKFTLLSTQKLMSRPVVYFNEFKK